MPRLVAYSVAVVMAISFFADRAWAEVDQQSVTPASVKAGGSRFSVTAEKRDDGLIHFAITYRLPRPQYLVAHFELRDGATTLVKTDTSSFVRETSARYDLAVSPKRLADAKFELSGNAFGESGGQPVATPGGTDYRIDLQAFGKNVPVAKAD